MLTQGDACDEDVTPNLAILKVSARSRQSVESSLGIGSIPRFWPVKLLAAMRWLPYALQYGHRFARPIHTEPSHECRQPILDRFISKQHR